MIFVCICIHPGDAQFSRFILSVIQISEQCRCCYSWVFHELHKTVVCIRSLWQLVTGSCCCRCWWK